jgi:hypothetical protein
MASQFFREKVQALLLLGVGRTINGLVAGGRGGGTETVTKSKKSLFLCHELDLNQHPGLPQRTSLFILIVVFVYPVPHAANGYVRGRSTRSKKILCWILFDFFILKGTPHRS